MLEPQQRTCLKARAREEYQLQEEQKELGMTWAQVLIVPFDETVHNSGSLFCNLFSEEFQRSTCLFTKCHTICHASLLMTDIDNAQERFRRAQEQVQTKAGSRVVFIDLFS